MKTRGRSPEQNLVPFPGVRRPWRRLVRVIGVVIAIGVVAAGWAMVTWRVDAVRVAGASMLPPDRIVRAAALSGSERILVTRMTPVRERVEQLPGVRSVTIERDLPSTVVIHVAERVPLVRLAGIAGLVADQEGRVFEAPEADTYPQLTGWKIEEPTPGDALRDAMTRVLDAYGRFPVGFRDRVDLVDGSGEALVIVLSGGIEVRFGRPVDLVGKAAAALSVVEHNERTGTDIAYVDVRSPRTPVVGERTAPEEEDG